MTSNRTPAIRGGDPIFPHTVGYGSQAIGESEQEAVLEALNSSYITRGPRVSQFESAVADFVGVEYAVAVTSGTAALHLAGLAAGLGPGDEVLTTPLTFTATANLACHAGAEPVFVDVREDTRNLDPDALERHVTEDTRAVVPMHYAGHPCRIDEILDFADRHDLAVVWDACHAFGSRWRGSRIGAERDMAVFSFHPVKNITTGEGGMIVTDDAEVAARIRSYRSFTMNADVPGHEDEPWYQVTESVGYNYNFTDIQAALGLAQLERIGEFKRARDRLVARYDELLSEVEGVETPTVRSDVDPMWHLYAVEIHDSFPCSRAEFVRAMHAENVGIQVHYVPLHHHPHFQERHGYSADRFPRTNALYERLVSLPLHPGLSDDDVDDIVLAIRSIADSYR